MLVYPNHEIDNPRVGLREWKRDLCDQRVLIDAGFHLSEWDKDWKTYKRDQHGLVMYLIVPDSPVHQKVRACFSYVAKVGAPVHVSVDKEMAQAIIRGRSNSDLMFINGGE